MARDRYSLLSRSAGWPAGLNELSDPPTSLRVEGRLPTFDRAVAIVGTRRADDDALRFAREIAHALGRRRWVVVSGGAGGIDAAAHEGALDSGAATVAVLGGGLDRPYPAAHRDLFQRIVSRGALLSEYRDRCDPRPWRFLMRNRLLAALAKLILVVQAPLRSGALSTAAHGRALGRPVMVVPAAPWDPRGGGSLLLLRNGAQLCRSVSDVFDALGVEASGSLPLGPSEAVSDPCGDGGRPLSLEQRRMLDVLGARPRHPDEISRATEIDAARVLELLLELELLGLVETRGGGGYVRRPRRPGLA